MGDNILLPLPAPDVQVPVDTSEVDNTLHPILDVLVVGDRTDECIPIICAPVSIATCTPVSTSGTATPGSTSGTPVSTSGTPVSAIGTPALDSTVLDDESSLAGKYKIKMSSTASNSISGNRSSKTKIVSIQGVLISKYKVPDLRKLACRIGILGTRAANKTELCTKIEELLIGGTGTFIKKIITNYY